MAFSTTAGAAQMHANPIMPLAGRFYRMMQERLQKGHAELDSGDFDEGYDVIVAGYGFGGGIAAIEAARQGAKVLICEKMPQPGGISICSGGAVRCAADADAAFAYLKATNAGTTPDDVLRALAD